MSSSVCSEKSPPCQVNLYEVTFNSVARFLPKLLEKIQATGKKVLVLTETEEQAEEISHTLWTYSQQSFLRHGTKKDGRPLHQPIYLTSEGKNLNNASVLVVLGEHLDLSLEEYERCVDIFDGTQEAYVQKACQRYRSYLTKGYKTTYWRQGSSGSWESVTF